MEDTQLSLSIIIPTYNRKDLVGDAIASARTWMTAIGAGEIIVVDDASTDGTLEHVAAVFAADVAAGAIALVRLPTNIGVTGAKNVGARHASGQWLVFLDSDDMLVPETAQPVCRALQDAGSSPVLFFRAVDFNTGAAIGAPIERPREIYPRDLLHGWRYGDCIPIARREILDACPYVGELRGHEGLTWLRISRHFGPIRMMPFVVLRVRRDGHERISTATFLTRSCLNARGHWIILREFHDLMPPLGWARYLQFIVRAAIGCLWLGIRKRIGRGAPRSSVPAASQRS